MNNWWEAGQQLREERSVSRWRFCVEDWGYCRMQERAAGELHRQMVCAKRTVSVVVAFRDNKWWRCNSPAETGRRKPTCM